MRDLTDREIAAYRSDGVAHLPALVDAATVARLLVAADERMAEPGPFGRNLTDDGFFFQDRDLYRDQQVFADFARDSGFAALAGRAMGASRISLYFDHLFALGPNSAKDAYYWHQDQPYWACAGEQVCSIWLALTDCALDSGALEFVKGTDRGLLHLPTRFGENSEHAEGADGAHVPDGMTEDPPPAFHDNRDRYEILTWDIRAGDALMFNTKIMHSSRGNHSPDQRRVAYSTRWVGDDVTFSVTPGFQDPITFPEDGFPQGGKMTEAKKFPVYWRAG